MGDQDISRVLVDHRADVGGAVRGIAQRQGVHRALQSLDYQVRGLVGQEDETDQPNIAGRPSRRQRG